MLCSGCFLLVCTTGLCDKQRTKYEKITGSTEKGGLIDNRINVLVEAAPGKITIMHV